MSGSLNKVILIGNLGKDPELKMTPSGQPLARFSLATTETWRTPSGEKQQKTEWHNIVVWGKQAETAEKYLRKGKQVMIEGRIQYRDYTDQSGVKKVYTEIRCDNFVMLGRMEDSSRQGGGSYERPTASGGQDYEDHAPPPSQGGFDDDIPF
ncbi:MAG: single-stranded DNA-binding protein [Holophagales bacterium]|jgi:single-strand DNA-binding protein|nr:single-stranded DNA-binding protein [Holophagales bacterium]